MRPIAQSDGHDGPGLSLQPIPSIAAVIEQSIVVVEHAVGQPVIAEILPDVLLWVQLGTLRRQRHDSDIGRHHELVREVPTGLVEQQHRVSSWGDICGNRREMQVHRRGVAPGQDQSDSLALLWADGAKDVGGRGPLVGRC